jgi:hypothetical protein
MSIIFSICPASGKNFPSLYFGFIHDGTYRTIFKKPHFPYLKIAAEFSFLL